MRRYAVEFIGTFFLVLTIGCTGLAAAPGVIAPLAIGGVLMAMIYEQLFFFSTCTEAIRTIPLLQHDADWPEDLDTEAEDHAADSVRYACMSRPYTRSAPKPKEPEPMRGFERATVNEWLKAIEPKRLRV